MYNNTTPGEVLELGNPKLGKRRGGNRFTGFSGSSCDRGFLSPPTFLVEACITVLGGSGTMYSGYLWRENVGGVHPTADWYPQFHRWGQNIHHRGIYSSQYDSCDDGGSAYHRLVHC